MRKQPGLFASPPAVPPRRSPVAEAVVVFAVRHQGRQFTLTDLDNAARRDVPGLAFGAGRKALVELQAAGTVVAEPITAGIWRIMAVKP